MIRVTLAFAILATLTSGLSSWTLKQPAMELKQWSNQDGPFELKINVLAPHMLVVPKIKLLFCFIPKNGCTQFNQLMNSLNGFVDHLGDVCSTEDPNFRSQWPAVLNTTDTEALNSLIEDPSWTKGVFLRDPFERLLSAYRSKCEPPQECQGLQCMGWKGLTAQNYPDFDAFVYRMGNNQNYKLDEHFVPQSSFCGGLNGSSIVKYDYVGHITTDYDRVAEQVQDMMMMAVNRSQPEANDSAGQTVGTTKQEVLAQVQKYFPPSGPSDSSGHTHKTENVGAYYERWGTHHTAMSYYADDFELLQRFE